MQSKFFKTILLIVALTFINTSFANDNKSTKVHLKDQNKAISLNIPSQLKEQCSLNSCRFSATNNPLNVYIKIIEQKQNNFQNIVSKKISEIILNPIDNSQKDLYRNVEILKDDSQGPEKSFEYKGVITKKDADKIYLQKMLHESFLLRKNKIIQTQCEVSHKDKSITEDKIIEIDNICQSIIDSILVN